MDRALNGRWRECRREAFRKAPPLHYPARTRVRALASSGKSRKRVVLGRVDGLEPFVARADAGHLDGEVREPAVPCGAVPVLDACGDLDDVAWCEAFFPSSWYQPRPATQTRIWPPPDLAVWTCQLLRQAGSNVTFQTPAASVVASGASQLRPLKYFAKPVLGLPIGKIIEA